MTDAKLDASVKLDVDSFFKKFNAESEVKPSETLRSHTSYYVQKIYEKGLRLNKKVV